MSADKLTRHHIIIWNESEYNNVVVAVLDYFYAVPEKFAHTNYFRMSGQSFRVENLRGLNVKQVVSLEEFEQLNNIKVVYP